mgnify:CR=1 FL=1
MPHVQNLFQDGTYRYHRVISLSRSVDINDGDRPGSGVLLVDMKYSVVENVLKQINESSDGVTIMFVIGTGNFSTIQEEQR